MFLSILMRTLVPFGAILGILLIFLLARARFAFLRIIPLWVIILVLVVFLLVWLAVLLIKWTIEKRRAKAIEDGILDQAQQGIDQASPANRTEIEELKRNLAEALATLRKGPQGKKAIYSLPWYMIIGPPAVGKTTAIVNSGLNFPSMTTAKRMRGAGGTRNCDWWFSTDAILLDTAGRYAESIDRSETETEWFAFLDLLKTHRKKGPINGLILAYSIEDLLQKDEAGLIDSARELRQRMDEILDRLGWTFPVYVLFTKCDLISGFADYFSSLSPVERQQVWGAIYPLEPEGDQRAAERFSREYDLLLKDLRNMRTRRMSGISRSENWGRIFMFPEEFANLKDKMVLFIETLFEANPYRKDLPLFRGTYFSSGKQLGKPFDLVVRKIQSMLGAGADVEEVGEQEEKEDAYFVRDLFAKVLKIDRDMVRLTGESARRQARVALFVSVGFLALAILACIWVGFSYGHLRAKMDRTRSKAVAVRDQVELGTTVDELRNLEPLRQEITGSWNSFPLVVTDTVHIAAKEVWLQAVTDRILGPLENGIAAKLYNPGHLTGAEVRRTLRAELMLLRPEEKKEIGWGAQDLAEGLCTFGLEGVQASDDARRQLNDMAEEFLELGQPLRVVDRDYELRRGAQRLSATHTPPEFFRGILYGASQAVDDLTLELLVPDQSILHTDRTVRAAFTRAGWERSVLPQINDVGKTVDADNKLISMAGGVPTREEPSRQELLRLYVDAHPEEWIAFLESIHLGDYRTCEDFEDDLRKLRLPKTSPLLSLLREVAAIASLDVKTPGGVLPGSDTSDIIERVQAAMRPLMVLTGASDDQPAQLDDYAEQLDQVFDQVKNCASEPGSVFDSGVLRKAEIWLDDFVDDCDEEPGGDQMASALRVLMRRPIDDASRVLGHSSLESAKTRLRQVWDDRVVEAFKGDLADTYPFANTERTAALHDVTGFFGPDGDMAEFARTREQSVASAYPGRRAQRALRTAEAIRRDLGMTDEAFQAQFTLEAQQVRSMGTPKGDENRSKIDQIVLTINGDPLVDRIVHNKREFNWSTDDDTQSCSLVLKSTKYRQVVASIHFDDSIWSLCRLFDERTKILGNNEIGRVVVWTFPEEEIKVEFHLTTRDKKEPFFIRGSAFREFSIPTEVHR